MPKKIPKKQLWKYHELNDEDKTDIKMAAACYVKKLESPDKPPKYSIIIARDIIPYMVCEDDKWSTVDPATVTQSVKIPAFKQYVDLVRSALRSQVQMARYIKLVEERENPVDDPEEEGEEESVEVPSYNDEGSQIRENSLL